MRQYVSPRMPERGVVTATGGDYRHLRRVLRVRVGDMVDVRLPDGTMMSATVCQVDDNRCVVKMAMCAGIASQVAQVGSNRNDGGVLSYPSITLFQFIPRPAKMEVILRQAVECAVDTVVPVAGEYSQAGYIEAMADGPTTRMQRVIKEAMEQSGAAHPLAVTRAMSMDEAIEWWQLLSIKDGEPPRQAKHSEATIAIALSERNAASPYDVLSECRNIKRAAIAVGSEGGISVKEEEQLKDAWFRSVHFGCNIMRCETAALYGVAVIREMLCKK